MKNKLLFVLLLSLAGSAAQAALICRIQGTSQTAGIGQKEPYGDIIYVSGRGYYPITSYEENNSVAVSARNGRVVRFDYGKKLLTIGDEKPVKLVSCRSAGE